MKEIKKIKKMKEIKKIKKTNKMKEIKKIKKTNKMKEINKPIFISTEGEDNIESNLSFLIELLGSSLLETYVEDILNIHSSKIINIRQVPHPTNPPKEELTSGQPIIFYGNYKATHYTCSIDGTHIWDSYRQNIQVNGTDHFCQIFALMCIENAVFPNSYISKQFSNLKNKQFMENAFIAKNVACDILELLNSDFNIIQIVKEVLISTDRSGNIRHKLNPKANFTINNFIKYCRNLTLTDMYNSSFKQKVFMTI